MGGRTFPDGQANFFTSGSVDTCVDNAVHLLGAFVLQV
jgi:hypothetical protein